MTKTAVLLCLILAAPIPAVRAQGHDAAPAGKPATLFQGLGHLHHPIHTASLEAQRFFDQGLTLVYAFNHEEAARSFEHAAALDPKSPMPFWGIALAVGPNYNMDVDLDREKQAYDAIQKALALANHAPANERDYCAALAKRFSNDPKADPHQLALNYKDAMRNLAARYPDDPDAATLYAESMMDLHAWQLWTLDGRPGEYTDEIVTVLRAVLRREPEHIGANHYYIHALEASPHPEDALLSARRLETAVPAAGHLVHMPAHIYARTGDYEGAEKANVAAAAADVAYVHATAAAGSLYDMMYYSHNLHFLAAACQMEGRLACARQAADKLAAHVTPGVKQMSMLEWFMPYSIFIRVRFARWEEMLAQPKPEASMPLTTAIWHYGRGLAYAAKGDVPRAGAERQQLADAIEKTPADAPYGYNTARAFLTIAEQVLDARIASARGDRKTAIDDLRRAVAGQDAFNYDEPPDWYYPVRESLGAALLLDGQAAEAEKVFREDLDRNPRNGRSLFGLWKSLETQGKSAHAMWVKGEFDTAWKNADVKLSLEDL